MLKPQRRVHGVHGLPLIFRLSSQTIGLLGLGCETGHSTRFGENWSFVDVIPYVRWRLNLVS